MFAKTSILKEPRMTDRKALEDSIRADMKKIKARLKNSASDASQAGLSPDQVPYDKQAARTVIEKFLKTHPDPNRFMADLKSRMDS